MIDVLSVLHRPMFQTKQWRIFVDDIVKVVTGAEKGASGKVLAVIKDTKQPEVIIEGVNLVSIRFKLHISCDLGPISLRNMSALAYVECMAA